MICVCWLIRLANSLDGGNKLEHWLLTKQILISLQSAVYVGINISSSSSSSNTNADPGVDCGKLVCFIMICVWSMWKLLSYSSAGQCRPQTC